MRGVEIKIRELLRELAGEVGLDPGLEGRTLRRARRRRVRNGALGAAGALGMLVAAAVATRALLAPLPGGPSPRQAPSSPSVAPGAAFPGIYPQTSWEELERDQRAVDEGHHPLWTAPEAVAAEFAVAVLGWDPEDVVTERNPRQDLGAGVYISNPSLRPELPEPGTQVQLEQLGRTGPGGIWTVTSVSGVGIVLEGIDAFQEVRPGQELEVRGGLTLGTEATAVEVSLFDGPLTGEPAAATTVPDQAGFGPRLTVPPSADGTLTLLVRAVEPDGRAWSATALPLLVAGAREPAVPRLEPQAGLPEAVAAKREAIFLAAAAGDLEGLAALADPATFTFSYGADRDPVRYWRAIEAAGGEGPAEVIPELLHAPYGTLRSGGRTLYVWPFAAAMDDLSALTPAQRQALRALGYTERDIRSFVAAGGFLGWRLGITEDGRWIFYVAGD
ncbi:MAG TPA: hypothetical protein VNO79_13735 [Actinomycetota bacterium]|nr:hypothetical protein [Actinomycetota bacterium]